jgi:hypothetical protein
VGLLVMVSLLVSFNSLAVDLYVATNGVNDNAVGRGQSVGNPYLTIDYAGDRATPGTTVFIRGGVYREQVTPAVSGTLANPIVFKPYTNTETVVISGCNLITPGSGGAGNWTVDSGQVYKIQLTASYGSTYAAQAGEQVFVNGQLMGEARWPNSSNPIDFDRRNMAAADSGAFLPGGVGNLSNATYVASALAAFPTNAWAGGVMVFNPGYGWYNRTTTTLDGNTNSSLYFRFDPFTPHRETPSLGDPFILMGRRVALDAPGEAYYDNVGRDGAQYTLYVYQPGGGSPATSQVEMRRRTEGITVGNVSNLRFENLTVRAASISTGTSSSNCIFDGINLEYGDPHWQEYRYTFAFKLQGNNHQFNNGRVFGSLDEGIRVETGSGHIITNNVISECLRSGIGTQNNPVLSNLRYEHNTLHTIGGGGISAFGAPGDILYTHGYNVGLLATDISIIGMLGPYDGQNSEWAYNWLHDNLAVRDSSRTWNGGSAIRTDTGGSNYRIHHNVCWNTTLDPIQLWAIATNALNFQNANIRVYNNTVDSTIGLYETASTPASIKGFDVRNNLCGAGFTITSSSTDAQGKLYQTDVILKNNIFSVTPNPAIANNPTPPHTNNWRVPTGWVDGVSHDFELTAGAWAIDRGEVIPGITDGFLGAAPDIGALEYGARPFIAGALARPQDLSGLVVTVQTNVSPLRFAVTGLPQGRRLARTAALKIGTSAATNDFAFNYDISNHLATATFLAASTPGLNQSVQISLDGVSFVTLPGTINVPTQLVATVTSLTSSTNPAPVGTSVTFTATVTSGNGTPVGSVVFYNGVVPLTTNTLDGSGVTMLTVSDLGFGTHAITAAYGGTTIFAASSSEIVSQSMTYTPTGTPVTAYFTDGPGSATPQQYPGTAGDGWVGGWTGTSLATPLVANGSPLKPGTGNYLTVTRTSGSGSGSQEGVYRQWSESALPTTNFTRLTFDLRLEPNANFSTAADAYSVSLNSVSGVSPGANSTVYIRAFGAANGAMAAREWCVFNGDPGLVNAYDLARFRPTGLVAQPGVTYHFTVDIFAGMGAGTYNGKTNGTYDVTITDGTNTVTVVNSGFRSAAYSAGGYLAFAAQQDVATDNLAFSVDSIVMSMLLPPTPPVILSSPVNAGQLALSVATQTGYGYVLLNATNLNPPVVWSPVVTNNGTGGIITNIVPAGPVPPEQYFRYQVQ